MMVLPSNPTCDACDLHEYASRRCIPTVRHQRGAPDSPALVLVGQEPGREEDASGYPFVGKSGNLVKQVYLAPIPTTIPVYLSNTARCYKPSTLNLTPSSRPYRTCSALYLLPDLLTLSSLHPRLIILALGAPAAYNLTRHYLGRGLSLRDIFGRQPLTLPLPATLFATYHPAYILRDASKIRTVSDHMALIHRALMDPHPTRALPNLVPPFPPPPA